MLEGDATFCWNAVCVECAPSDFDAMVDLYERLLGLEVIDREESWAALRDPRGGMGMNIQADGDYVPPVWPQRSGAPAMMMHFEIEVRDVESAVAEAVALGAAEAAWQPPDRDPLELRVMVDPAGHPFCLWI